MEKYYHHFLFLLVSICAISLLSGVKTKSFKFIFPVLIVVSSKYLNRFHVVTQNAPKFIYKTNCWDFHGDVMMYEYRYLKWRSFAILIFRKQIFYSAAASPCDSACVVIQNLNEIVQCAAVLWPTILLRRESFEFFKFRILVIRFSSKSESASLSQI